MYKDQYRQKIESFYRRLLSVSENTSSIKLAADKWSLKEMVGHLIDSASNNHQRFIRLQETDNLIFPLYNPEFWVETSKYNEYIWNDLVTVWYSYNCLLLHIVSRIDKTKTGNTWEREDDGKTLGFLVEDYYRHLDWHIDFFDKRLIEIQGA